MKTVLAALAGASILAAAYPATAQSHHGGFHGGGSTGGSGGMSHSGGSGGFSGGSAGQWRPGDPRGGAGFRHFRGHDHFRGAPFAFGGFGLGLALGLSADYPWYYDAPFYGYYPEYVYEVAPPPYAYYPPPRYDSDAYAPPPAADTARPPAACGSWRWDTAKSVYNWVPC